MAEIGKNRHLSLLAVIGFGLLTCVLYGIGSGLRSDIGILLEPLAAQCQISYASVSFCIAVMQLVFGASQPVFGIIAARRSNRLILFLGAGFLAASFLGMMFSRSFIGLFFSLSILFGLGAGALSFGLILTSAIYFVGKHNAMIVAGMLNASAGMCGFFLSPGMQALLNLGGTSLTMEVLLIPIAALIPISIFVTSRDPKREETATAEEGPSLANLKAAFHNRVYLFTLAGFSTCGFHMVIIEAHLFPQFISYGLAAQAASWAFSVYGLATIVGALLSGYLSTRLKKGRLLSFYYGFRAVWSIIYLFFLPKNMVTAILFAIGLGMTGDATVSPTSGLVSDNFNIKEVATLMGILFLFHQFGAFLSAWLGGVLLQLTGGYTVIWCLDMAVCLFASCMSYQIDRVRE